MMTPKGAAKAVVRMALLKYFPADPEARAVLMEDLGSICENDEQADWLARRVLDLCREWPGELPLWQIYFAKYPPRNKRQRELDRSCGTTEAFPDGVPSETGRQEFEPARLPVGAERRQIAAPKDPAAAKLLAEVMGGVKDVPVPAVPTLEEIDREIKARVAAENAPKPRIAPRVEPEKPITAEDIERAKAERKQPVEVGNV